MSLISLRNFTSPLRSRFQIGVLVVLALMVAAVRYGSRTEGGGAATPSRFEEEAQNREIESFLRDSESRARDYRQQKQPSQPKVEELEELANGAFERNRKREADSRDKAGKFDDIRKSLGLE